jgi:hypothetical protein
MARMDYKVWECKIVVPADAELPDGFDQPPRSAAIQAVSKEMKVNECFSGWGGLLTKDEEKVLSYVTTAQRTSKKDE